MFLQSLAFLVGECSFSAIGVETARGKLLGLINHDFDDRLIERYRERVCGRQAKFLVAIAPIFNESDVWCRNSSDNRHSAIVDTPFRSAISRFFFLSPRASTMPAPPPRLPAPMTLAAPPMCSIAAISSWTSDGTTPSAT